MSKNIYTKIYIDIDAINLNTFDNFALKKKSTEVTHKNT